MSCVADDGDAAFCVSGWRVLSKVKDRPLRILRQLVIKNAVSCMGRFTYNVEVLVRQLQQTHHIVAVSRKVPESVFTVCRSRQLVGVFPGFVCCSKGNDVEGFTMLDGECQDVSIGTQLSLPLV